MISMIHVIPVIYKKAFGLKTMSRCLLVSEIGHAQYEMGSAFYESTATEPPPAIGQVGGVFANRRKVVLEVRPDVHFIPFNQDALPNWGATSKLYLCPQEAFQHLRSRSRPAC